MLRRPPPNVPFSYPPKANKSKKKKKKKKGIRRRRKTNVRREIAFAERMTLPYRQKQTAQDFMSVHQQSLINQARDLQETNRKKQLEVEKASKEDLQLRKDTLELQKAQISNQEKREQARQELEEAKEVQRRKEVVEQRQEVIQQREEERQRENRRLNEEQNRRLQEFQLRQQEIRLRNEEIQKARALQIDNQRNQERIAREFITRQNNQNRLLTDLFRGLSQEIQERQAVGERRQGELEQRIQQEIRDIANRNIPIPTIPDIRIGEGARITMPTPVIQLNQPRPIPEPIPEVEEIEELPSTSTAIPLRDRPAQRRARSMVEEARRGLQDPPLTEAEAQEVRNRIYSSLMNVGERVAPSSSPLQIEAPSGLDYSGIASPPPFQPQTSRPDRQPEPLNIGDANRQVGNDALSTLRNEAQRLRDIATISSESQRQRNLRAFIDEAGDDDAVFVGSPRPEPTDSDSPPPSPPIPTPQLEEPEPEVEVGLGQQVAGVVGTGLSNVAQAGVGLAGDLASGVATGVYDATIGQLPTASEVGQALGSGAVQGVSNVARAVGTGIGQATGLLEPEPEQTEEEIRTQARLEEYDRLVNTNINQRIKKQDPRGRMKLVILEDLPQTWYKNNRGAIPTKKGTYPIRNYGAGQSDINNTRGFNFYDPERDREFTLQLYNPERDKAFRQLIKDKKIKFVFDEPNI